MDEWPGPQLHAVYDPVRAPVPPAEDPSAWSEVTADELRARSERIQRHQEELGARGVLMLGYTADGRLHYFARDQAAAERLLWERFGAEAELLYLGASLRALRPHPFGSWGTEGRSLHVFYGLPRNGERFAGCVIAEEEACVIVSLLIVDWLGNKTLVGGHVPSHVTVSLAADLGDRVVIDNFDNRVRPHWKVAAEVPLPRPQDL